MKRACLIIFLSFLIVTALSISDQLSFERVASEYANFKQITDNNHLRSLLIFFAVYIVTVALSLPLASMLTFGGAALFGWAALPVIVVAATLGATIIFLLSRSIAREFFSRRVEGAIDSIRAVFLQSPIRWCFTMRMIPFFPFWFVNIVPALLGMRLSDYLWATTLGILPGTAIYVGVGQGFDAVLMSGQVPDLELIKRFDIWIPMVLLAGLSGLSAWISNQKQRGDKK